MLNAEINTFVGQPKGSRQAWTLDLLESAYEGLDDIGDQVSATIAAALREK
jgi:hypothetical protein